MRPEDYHEYINGLTQMASAASVYCGPSEIRAACFSTKSFAPLFCKAYHIKPSLLTLKESDSSLYDLLAAWLGDEPRGGTDGLCHLLHFRLGDAIQCYEVENIGPLRDAISSPHKYAPFYTTEDLFFAVFRDVAVCFIMGNFE